MVKRRVIRGNPLRNPSILSKLNPHSSALKAYARATNGKQRQAREVLLRKKSGIKVSEAELKKATALLGSKAMVSAKEFRAKLKKRKEAKAAVAANMEVALKKKKEKAKANAANPRKPTKK